MLQFIEMVYLGSKFFIGVVLKFLIDGFFGNESPELFGGVSDGLDLMDSVQLARVMFLDKRQSTLRNCIEILKSRANVL